MQHTFQRTGSLKVVLANEDELATHEAILADLDKTVGGSCIYHADLTDGKSNEPLSEPEPEDDDSDEDELENI